MRIELHRECAQHIDQQPVTQFRVGERTHIQLVDLALINVFAGSFVQRDTVGELGE
jgi:hypothetical protein